MGVWGYVLMFVRSLLTKYKNELIVVLLFGSFFALRLYRLGFHDFWFDEIATIEYARFPWGNWNAPLYWIVLHYWVKLFGFSEFSLRFPSLLFNFSAVIITFLIGKDLFKARVGLLAAVIMGFSPFHLWYAQEARDYSLTLFLGTLSSLLLLKAIRKDKGLYWVFFTVVSLAGLFTNYFYVILFMMQGALLVVVKGSKIRFREFFCFVVLAFGFLIYLPRFLSKFIYISKGFWVPVPDALSLRITFENFFLGYNGWPELYVMADIVMGLLVAVVCWRVIKSKEWRHGLLICLAAVIVPVSGIFLFSKVFFSIYLDRAMIHFSPYFYLIISAGVMILPRLSRVVLVSGILGMLLVANVAYFQDWMPLPPKHHNGVWLKKPVRPAVQFLQKNIQPGDRVAFTNTSLIPSWMFYSGDRKFDYYFLFDPKFPDTNWQRPIQESGSDIPFYKTESLLFQRLWVVYSDWQRDGRVSDGSLSCQEWLDENMVQEFEQEFDGMLIVRYVRRQP